MDAIIDSSLSIEDALKQNPNMPCRSEILRRQRVINVLYYSFDNKLHKGQIVVDKDLIKDVQDAFDLLLKEKFPITSIIPIADPRFHWGDEVSVEANNSSGFNYRKIANTDRISNHAFGRAIDINPGINPFISASGQVSPKGAIYDPTKPGTIAADSQLVQFFTKRGWEWGGAWVDRKDYQHFQKPKP